jgi:hypothetical protein
MITAERLATLTNFSADELTRATKDSGYRDGDFLTARFLGMTNNLQFCYQVQFSDDEGQLQAGKVFLTYNPVHGTVIAEY